MNINKEFQRVDNWRIKNYHKVFKVKKIITFLVKEKFNLEL